MSKKGIVKSLAEALFAAEAGAAARWAAAAHQRLMTAQWGLKPTPNHFDHHIDLYFQWRNSRNAMWLQRGVYSTLALRGGDLLELSCGDGFNARNFYSLHCKKVIGCDLDGEAIETARRKNHADNIEYIIADIRTAMPEGKFGNVIWDFAFPLLDFFKLEELENICQQIKVRLEPDGIFSGYTLAEQHVSPTPGFQIRSVDDLHGFLSKYFQHSTVFETTTPGRRNLYFWASEGSLPFSAGWPNIRTS